jgi:uncharacterized protein
MTRYWPDVTTPPEEDCMKLSDGERLILMMLAEIGKHLRAVAPADIPFQPDVDPDFVKRAIDADHPWGLKWHYQGIFPEGIGNDAPSEVYETGTILTMWRAIEQSYNRLPDAEKQRVLTAIGGDAPAFAGFNGNIDKHYGIAKYMVEQLGAFEELRGRDLNSHGPDIDRYRRMIPVWTDSIPQHSLSADSIIAICSA